MHSDIPTIDSGAKIVLLYLDREILVSNVYAMETEKQFGNTLDDNIRKQGAMVKVISDRA